MGDTLCIIAGIALGKIFPGVAQSLDSMSDRYPDLPVFHDVSHYGED